MKSTGVEQRRERRVSFEAPLQVWNASQPRPPSPTSHLAKNLSLHGLYFETDESYAVNDVVATSVSVPESSLHTFPFTRLIGRSRVVRVDRPSPGPDASGSPPAGVALQFLDTMTVLTNIPDPK
jgi:hypothetical protein